jgi:hypothetical protein
MPHAPDLHTCGPMGLHSASCLLPPLGDLRHLRLPTKFDKRFFWVNESVTNRKPHSRGSLWVPFAPSRRLTPNSVCKSLSWWLQRRSAFHWHLHWDDPYFLPPWQGLRGSCSWQGVWLPRCNPRRWHHERHGLGGPPGRALMN